MGLLLSGFPRVRNQLTLSHIGIRAIPWFPFELIGGYLASVSAFIIGWFRGFLSCTSHILCTPEMYFGWVTTSLSSNSFHIIGLRVTLALD